MENHQELSRMINQDHAPVMSSIVNSQDLQQDPGGPEDFYLQLGEHIHDGLGARATIIWRIEEEGQLAIIGDINLNSDDIDSDTEHFNRHVELAFAATEKRSAIAVHPEGGLASNSDDLFERLVNKHTQIIIPIQRRFDCVAAVAVFVDATKEISEVDLTIIQQQVDLIAARRDCQDVETNTELIENETTNLQKLNRLQQNVIRNLDIKKNAYDVVNEVHSYLGTGRVTLMIFRGTSCRVKGVSGTANFNRRSPILKHIEKIGAVAGKTRQSIFLPDDNQQFPGQLKNRFEKYFEAADTRSLALIPLIYKDEPSTDPNNMAAVIRDRDSKPGKVVGVIAIEGLNEILDRETLLPIWKPCEASVTHSVANSHRYNSFFLMPVWRRLGQLADLFRGHHRNKAVAGTIAAILLLCFLTLVPAEFRLGSQGNIRPTQRAQIFAGVDAIVSEVFVNDGDEVNQGDLLMRLSNPELEAEYVEIEGELLANKAALTTLMRQRMLGLYDNDKDESQRETYRTQRSELMHETTVHESKVVSLEQQLTFLKEQKSMLEVRSPRDGIVMNWNIKNRLNQRPVKSGDLLMLIAQPKGPWELEVRVPDRRAGYMINAWEKSNENDRPVVTYCLASDPSRKHTGRIREIARIANVDGKKGNVIRAYVDIDDHPGNGQLQAKPGTEVLAHIHAGKRSVGYCKLYEFIDWTKRTWFTYIN